MTRLTRPIGSKPFEPYPEPDSEYRAWVLAQNKTLTIEDLAGGKCAVSPPGSQKARTLQGVEWRAKKPSE